jgi:adenylosuccinate lyase
MQQLAFRYASPEMRRIWGEERKFITWRQLWIAIAESQLETGLKRITKDQISQLKSKVNSFTEDPKELHRLSVLEKETKHDVMAHIRLLGELCPKAKDIIHLGCTSCDITDNTDLILLRESLVLVCHKLVGVIEGFGIQAEIFTDTPCLAYTHYQPAQLTTFGKRVCLWLEDLVSDLQEVEKRISDIKFRGLKGASGTQDSYLRLFRSGDKVLELERRVAEKMGFDKVYPITGQTYSRKVDSLVLSALSSIGQTASKIGTDIRLLQHDYEVQEPFGEGQVGSSAMPYKRNPMCSERLCSLSRYLVNEAHNAETTAMTQWLERSLDDSAVRRISLPNAFLAVDAVLKLLLHLANGLIVNRQIMDARVQQNLPFILCEPLMMEVCKQGHDRQEAHAMLRDLCQKAHDQVHKRCMDNPLWDDLSKKETYRDVLKDLDKNPKNHTGRAGQQVKMFLKSVVFPILHKYPQSLRQTVEVDV